MNVRFGNLTAVGFNEKFDTNISEVDLMWIEQHRIDNAQTPTEDKLHIFDLPLGIVAGSAIVYELIARLEKYEFNHQFYVQEWL